MTSGVAVATFRDPAGSLSFEDDRVVRSIHPSSREAVLEFVESPFCRRQQDNGNLIAATIEDVGGGLRLLHPRIPVPTYPWEWTQSQWLAAAELTLQLCEEAVDEGWILKDATPLNILFVGPRPVLVDILSFERRDARSSIWLAYGQYIRTFLLPLVMNQMMSWPLALSLFRRDGYEPLELYRAMGWRQRLSRAALWPVTLAVWVDGRKGSRAPGTPLSAGKADAEMTAHLLKRTLTGLRRRTQRAVRRVAESDWADYQTTLSHYTPEQSERKHEWAQRVLEEMRPERVLDIGANTGEYSALAASLGAEVIALERDEASAERLFRMSCAKNLSIQTILGDVARPTPAAGWENGESIALLARLEGRSDVVMMLAVIHHLILMEQIPLTAIMGLCHRLTRRALIVEWVPVGDPMYQSLMRGRESLYASLTEADLLAACDGRFEVVRREVLGNGRILFLFEKRPG